MVGFVSLLSRWQKSITGRYHNYVAAFCSYRTIQRIQSKLLSGKQYLKANLGKSAPSKSRSIGLDEAIYIKVNDLGLTANEWQNFRLRFLEWINLPTVKEMREHENAITCPVVEFLGGKKIRPDTRLP